MTHLSEPNLVETLEIVHNEAASRFEAVVGGQLAVVDYERRGETIYVTHTRTPPAHRGRGVAAAVTQAALDYARAEGLAVVPICSYTVDYLARNPQAEQ